LFSTHVILTPGACWGGAELQSVDQIPWILRVLGVKQTTHHHQHHHHHHEFAQIIGSVSHSLVL